MRICPFYGCGRALPPVCFCCRAHWGTLTDEEREKIYDGIHRASAGEITREELREEQQRVLGARGHARRND